MVEQFDSTGLSHGYQKLKQESCVNKNSEVFTESIDGWYQEWYLKAIIAVTTFQLSIPFDYLNQLKNDLLSPLL